MQEVWKDIPGYEGLYQVSNLGRVKSLERYVRNRSKKIRKPERILSQSTNNGGYKCVNLCKDGVQQGSFVHRLVAQAFIKNCEDATQVNHINGNKQDNRPENLEWCSPTENMIHAWKTGLQSGIRKKNDIRSVKIAQYDKEMNIVKVFPSIREAGRNGFSAGKICECCKGKRKSYRDYIWKYA